jgi:hypothetical protein
MYRLWIWLSLLLLTSCAQVQFEQWDAHYGREQPKEMQITAPGPLTYYGNIKPLLDKRCVNCHGCYDAPCQLKQEAYAGLLRGANAQPVYGARLLAADPMRLFEDAQTTAQWRTNGFYPIFNERREEGANNVQLSLLAQTLLLKKAHPLPKGLLPDSFAIGLDAKHQCPRIETYQRFAKANPLAGMPYGLPGIKPAESKQLLDWVEQGAPMGTPPLLDHKIDKQVAQWEAFFNGPSLKHQLVSRYLYEHLFLAHIFFPDARGAHFRLVRSKTPPGEPIEQISTRRPYDDPQIARVYYRLRLDPSSLLAKTYMPYALSAARFEQWHQWFLNPNFTVDHLPNYNEVASANPFITFAQLPVDARYRFLLSEAQYTIMNFIKGPVCRGQVALNVIQDHFWVFFLAPQTQQGPTFADFLAHNSEHLYLPVMESNNLIPVSTWANYSRLQMNYLEAKAAYVRKSIKGEQNLGLGLIWDGDGSHNPNAALTIFRHNDSASVHQGLIGPDPKTAWVIGYPLLERIHYLLVAGFDVYGNVAHQLMSRLYMDFLRIEGEMNFVEFLPKKTQQTELAFWYRDAENDLQRYIDAYLNHLPARELINYTKAELYHALRQYLGKAASSPRNLTAQTPAAAVLANVKLPAQALQWLPQTTLLSIPGEGIFTLVHISAYSNLSSLFGEQYRRRPLEDQLIITQGVVGAYPNSFLRVSSAELPQMAAQMAGINSEADYRALKIRFGVRRTDANFWAHSDEIARLFLQQQPKEAAILDYNRLENR